MNKETTAILARVTSFTKKNPLPTSQKPRPTLPKHPTHVKDDDGGLRDVVIVLSEGSETELGGFGGGKSPDIEDDGEGNERKLIF